jgi:hypothetical protein
MKGSIKSGKNQIQRSVYLIALLFIAAIFWPIFNSEAQEQSGASTMFPSATVTRAQSPISIDGTLDESAWTNAPSIGEIRQREPNPGSMASEPTEVKLLYDDKNFYIGVICYDSEPERIIATQMARDADLSVDDKVEIVIDTFRDRRNGYYFATNPAGVLRDALVIENGKTNDQWDAIWYVRTARSELGWSAEFAIPFKTLSFEKEQNAWGFNISRTIKRKFEEDRWASPRLDVAFQQVSEAGIIKGFSGIGQMGLDVRLFVSGNTIHYGDSDSNESEIKPGGEIFYRLTPNLKWSTTFNTDFGETEVDGRQINLTRYPLFFPEKRAFFLEDTGIFEFGVPGGRRPELMPFFSRNIGLARGQQIPITVGTKLTGKADRYDIGIMDVLTRDEGDIEGENFLVTRVKRNLFTQSYVGLIFTDGNAKNPAASSQTYGVDLNLATSDFLGTGRNFQVTTYFMKSTNEGIEDKDSAYGISVDYPNDLWDLGVFLGEVQENFLPAIGFVSHGNTRKFAFSGMFSPRPKNFLNIRQMHYQLNFTYYSRLDYGQTESWSLQIAPVYYTFNSGDVIEVNYRPEFQRLFEPFEISRGIVLPAGDYRYDRYRVEFKTATKRRLSASVTWWFGDFYSGTADEITTSLSYKVGSHLQTTLSLNQTFARLQEGNFDAQVYSLRADYSFSPSLTLYNLVQFDNKSTNLGWQSRLRWTPKAGNDLFLVFNQGWIQDEEDDLRFHMTNRKLSFKLQYTFRF